mgnify:FL=1|tara:strand:+ start:4070 stop:5215 length:1146 start_codon:yes stop_codon:yes gene_type:complete
MRAETLILGGGIAGLSIARALARSSDQRAGSGVTLLEAEPTFGVHSSGLNAAILRTAIDAPATRALALTTAEELRNPPEDLGGRSFVDERGLVLLEGAPDAPAPRWLADHEARGAIESLTLEQAAERLPGFVPEGSRAWWLPGGGRIDIQRLLEALAESAASAGVQLRTGTRAERILCDSDGRALGVQLADGTTLEAERIVVANGGWAGQLARTAGAAFPARPTRRHLFVTVPDDSIDPNGPVIWDDVQGFYARPETGGLLVCLSDQDDCEPDSCAPDPMFWRVMERKLATCLPHLAGVPRARGWAAMRTLTENDTPIVGADPRVPGLFWAAALGGHGMSVSLGLGRVAADAILGTTRDEDLLARLAPDHPERDYQPVRNW